MFGKILLTTIFSLISLSAMAEYPNPIDDNIIRDAAEMSATGKGSEKYIDRSVSMRKATDNNIVKDSCLTNINLCAGERRARETQSGYNSGY